MRHVDHVLIATRDIDAAIARLRDDHGLGAMPKSSSMPGVVNAAIPLAPPLYLELVSAEDPAADPELANADDGLLSWAIEADDLDHIAAERRIPRSDAPHWSTVSANATPLPFFIRYTQGRPQRLPFWTDAYEKVAHECAPGRISSIAIGGPETHVRRWVGGVDVDITYAGGPLRIVSVTVETAAGPLVLD